MTKMQSQWRKLFASIVKDSDSEEECVDAEPAQPKITSLSKAIEIYRDA